MSSLRVGDDQAQRGPLEADRAEGPTLSCGTCVLSTPHRSAGWRTQVSAAALPKTPPATHRKLCRLFNPTPAQITSSPAARNPPRGGCPPIMTAEGALRSLAWCSITRIVACQLIGCGVSIVSGQATSTFSPPNDGNLSARYGQGRCFVPVRALLQHPLGLSKQPTIVQCDSQLPVNLSAAPSHGGFQTSKIVPRMETIYKANCRMNHETDLHFPHIMV